MAEEKQTVGKEFVKDTYKLNNFFNDLLKTNAACAFSVEIDKRTIIDDTDEHQIIKIFKGATLEIADSVPYRGSCVLKSRDVNPECTYALNLFSCRTSERQYGRGGLMYEGCELEKIAESCDFKKVGTKKFSVAGCEGGVKLAIPDDSVVAKLVLQKITPYTIHWRNAESRSYEYEEDGVYGEIITSGSRDVLFDKVIEYFKK